MEIDPARGSANDSASEPRLVVEARRLFRRYLVEFVEALGICPWAHAARRDGRVREVVMLDRALDVDAAVRAIEPLREDESIEIGVLIFPRADVDRPAFARFVAEVRAADAERHGGDVPFAMAEFHPETPAALTPSGAFVAFLRRTPDPTIQLVRRSALDRVRGDESHGSGFFDLSKIDLAALEQMVSEPARKQLHERVEDHNRETVASEGLARTCALLDELRADRCRTYAALGEALDGDSATAE